MALQRINIIQRHCKEHKSDSLGVNFVSLGFAQRKTFTDLIGLKRIENESRKLFAEQKTEQIVRVMPRLSDSYIVVIAT